MIRRRVARAHEFTSDVTGLLHNLLSTHTEHMLPEIDKLSILRRRVEGLILSCAFLGDKKILKSPLDALHMISPFEAGLRKIAKCLEFAVLVT